MKEPSVCCVMLVNGREKMVARAIKSFRDQTYPNKHLLLWNTGQEAVEPERAGIFPEKCPQCGYGEILRLADGGWTCRVGGCEMVGWPNGFVREILADRTSLFPRTIGELRNEANEHGSADLIAHFDSDDYSAPQRLMEQVALLEMSGKECVGYNDMLFWDETPGKFCGAWLWNDLDKRHPIGTSLLYRRSAWERIPFLALPNRAAATGEEYNWLKQVDALGVTSLPDYHGEAEKRPRMIASIHGGNTQHYDPSEYVAHNRGTSWKRAADWDAYCREVMAL